MAQEALSIDREPDRRDVDFLEGQINAYNREATGVTDGQLLGSFVRDDQGEVIAGVYGWIWGGCCEIRLLWVRDDLRGKGYGSALMRASEAEAARRGCTQVVLDTHSFQAPAFYSRLGYEVTGTFDDYPRGHRKLYMRKRLS